MAPSPCLSSSGRERCCCPPRFLYLKQGGSRRFWQQEGRERALRRNRQAIRGKTREVVSPAPELSSSSQGPLLMGAPLSVPWLLG